MDVYRPGVDGREGYMPLADCLGLLPTATTHAQVKAWAYRGARGVKLRTVRLGGTLLTRREWLEQFIREAADDKPPRAPREKPAAPPGGAPGMKKRRRRQGPPPSPGKGPRKAG
jgi:hypothetical protein